MAFIPMIFCVACGPASNASGVATSISNSTPNDGAKAEAQHLQASLSELMKRIATQQASLHERVRSTQSSVDQLAVRFKQAQSESERGQIRSELDNAQLAAKDALQANAIAEQTLFSANALAALSHQIAVGSSEIDAHPALAVKTLRQTQQSAVQLITSYGILEPAIAAQRHYADLSARARQALGANGGDAERILATPQATAAKASSALTNGDTTEAALQFTAAIAETNAQMQQFLDDLISKYGIIAQKKMAENDLQVAQAAITSAKALQQTEAEFD